MGLAIGMWMGMGMGDCDIFDNAGGNTSEGKGVGHSLEESKAVAGWGQGEDIFAHIVVWVVGLT